MGDDRAAPALGGELFRSLLDAVGDGIAVVREGRIAWCNRSLAALSGRKRPEDLVGESVESLFLEPGQSGASGPGGPPGDRWLHRAEGDPLPVRVRTLGPGEGAREVGWVIQERGRLRTLDTEVGRAGGVLEEASSELERLRERLRREATEREELLTVVSHELRTPVTVISGYSRLLLSEEVGPLNAAQRRFLESSAKSCKRIDTFIGNLIEAAREAAGDGGLHLVCASLEAAIQGVVQFLKPLLDEGGLRLETRLAPGTSHAWFDPMRLEQVLTNLLGNAIRYARRGGGVELATRLVGAAGGEGADFVEVSVSDDGLGIAPEDRERIFEPYVRSDEARSAGGLGLGLAICRRLVEAHGGRIAVEDRPGGGSSFRFTLRRAAPAEVR